MISRRAFVTGSSLALATGFTGLELPFNPALIRTADARDAVALEPRAGGDPVRLHYNENAAGCSPKVITAMQGAMDESNLYPVKREQAYTQAIAEYQNVAPENVIRGNGSSEILMVALLSAHQKANWRDLTVIAPEMSFEVVADLCSMWNIPYVRTPMKADLRVDMDTLRSTAEAKAAQGKPVMVYLTSPNNPTGDLVHSRGINDWVRNAHENIFFLLDEAYIDFVSDPSHESAIGLVREGLDNLVVARTFSKVYGLAGVRVGYGIAAPHVAQSMQSAMMAGSNVNVMALAAGVAALNDKAFYNASLASNVRARRITEGVLNELGLEFIPGETNFIFHRIGRPHGEYQQRMQEHGFKTGRLMGGQQGWSRLSMGLPEEMERFSEKLREFRKNGWV